MASRMEKYYNNPPVSRRSQKNIDLYRTLYDNEEYTNIASVATIDKTNEVDITKIRQMIKDRENYKKQREINQIIKPVSKEEKIEQPIPYEEEKTYDIRDVLSKAKETRKVDEKYESIKKQKYDYLLNSKLYQKKPEKIEDYVEEKELKELINTITSTSKINKLKDEELSLDLLEDLKSDNNTIIESSSVRAIIEEEKKRQEDIEKEKNIEVDKSFYTSSLNFDEKDFEDLKDVTPNEKKNNIWVKVILTIILILVVLIVGYIIYANLKTLYLIYKK